MSIQGCLGSLRRIKNEINGSTKEAPLKTNNNFKRSSKNGSTL